MIRVNLLPHREEKRKALRQQFYALAGLIAVLSGLIFILVHGIIAGYVNQQASKNEFLTKEIAALDKEIDEIKRLREQTDAMLARKRVIESLQSNRTESVRLFNELARQVPDGIYLKSVKQSGAHVSLVGYAQSNARVSALMRNLDASPLLEAPKLVEIRVVDIKLGAAVRRLAEFNMNVTITRTAEDAAKAGPQSKQDKRA